MMKSRKAIWIVAAAIGVPVLVIAGCVWMVRASLPNPSDVMFGDIVAARRDALRLMDECPIRSEGALEPKYLAASELPASLQIRKGVVAFVYRDHVSIVLHSNPDFLLGARMWRSGAVPPTRDKKTTYDDVTFFYVDKDSEKIGENQL